MYIKERKQHSLRNSHAVMTSDLTITGLFPTQCVLQKPISVSSEHDCVRAPGKLKVASVNNDSCVSFLEDQSKFAHKCHSMWRRLNKISSGPIPATDLLLHLPHWLNFFSAAAPSAAGFAYPCCPSSPALKQCTQKCSS